MSETPACVLEVEVQPRASRTELAGWREGRLRVRLQAPPVEGAANEALVAFLARRLDLPKRQVIIVGGAAARRKRLRVEGLDRAAVEARLQT
ncbi:MAG TPA: DUF167 domain-containing protein [Thermodesulfobacteriota bacterium]